MVELLIMLRIRPLIGKITKLHVEIELRREINSHVANYTLTTDVYRKNKKCFGCQFKKGELLYV